MNQILALAIKDLKLARRDKVGFFFMFVFPILTAIFFGTIFAGQGDPGTMAKPRVVIVDQDNSEFSRGLIADLQDTGDLELLAADSLDDANRAVLNAQAEAFVLIEHGFETALARPFWGDTASVKVVIDPSKRATGEMLRGIVTQQAFRQMQRTFSDQSIMQSSARDGMASLQADPDVPPLTRAALSQLLGGLDNLASALPAEGTDSSDNNPLSNWEPVSVTLESVARPTRKSNNPENMYAITFPQGMIWGILATAATFAISLVVERTHGTLLRLKSSPLGWSRILAGKALACAITILIVLTMLVVLARFGFGVQPVSIPFLIISMLCATICFVGIMMLLSVLGRTEAAVGGMSWAVLLIFAMFGGAMIPAVFMPQWMQGIAKASPVYWSILALEGPIWRGLAVTRMAQIWTILLAIGVACFTLGTILFRKLDSASA